MELLFEDFPQQGLYYIKLYAAGRRSDGRFGFEKNISSCTVSYTALPMKTDLHFQPTLS